MKKTLLNIALGRHIYSTYLLLIFMVLAPTAFFTDYIWLDHTVYAIIIMFGFFVFVTGIYGRKEAKESLKWPVAYGILKSSSLTYHTTSNSVRRYCPQILCEFEVLNKQYKCKSYDFSSEYTAKAIAQEKLDKIKSLDKIDIYYNPEDPNINVHIPGVHIVHIIRIILGILAMVLAYMFWFGYISI